MHIDGLLSHMAELGASDLFLKTPVPPAYKISGQVTLVDLPPLSPQDMDELALQALRPRDQEIFAARNQVDFSYCLPSGDRFRGNCYRQRDTIAMVFRRINSEVPTAEQLGLPNTLKALAMESRGLVLGTLHSTNANQSVERMLQFFTPDRHPELLSLMAMNLRGIASQRLIRGMSGQLCLVLEILMGTPRVRELLKRGDLHELKMAIQQGDRDGMQTFDQSVYQLYEQGLIDQESALLAADSPNDLRLKMRGFVSLGR